MAADRRRLQKAVEALAVAEEPASAELCRRTMVAAIAVLKRSECIVDGLEALLLVTATRRQAKQALDLGAAQPVQMVLKQNARNSAILAKKVATRLVQAELFGAEDEKISAQNDYLVSPTNLNTLCELFPDARLMKPPITKATPKRKKVKRRLEAAATFASCNLQLPKQDINPKKPKPKWSTADIGPPYTDVDAELFASAHLLSPTKPRHDIVRLLEMLFVPRKQVTTEQNRTKHALQIKKNHIIDASPTVLFKYQAEQRLQFAAKFARRILVYAIYGTTTFPQLNDTTVDPCHLLQLYQSLDTEGRGRVTREQFATTLRCVVGSKLSEDEVTALVQHYLRLTLPLDDQTLGASYSNASSKKICKNEELIDYELFCASGKIGRVFRSSAPASLPPVTPWIKQQTLNENSAQIAPSRGKTWQYHVRRMHEERTASYAYLVRRGAEAIRHTRSCREARKWLRLTAHRSDILVKIRLEARIAIRHVIKQNLARVWLSQRIRRAANHKRQQTDAFWYLKTRHARKAQDAQSELALRRTNQQRAFELIYNRRKAFTYLALTRGAIAKQRGPLLSATVEALTSLGQRAKTAYHARLCVQDSLRHRACLAVTARDRKEMAAATLRFHGKRAISSKRRRAKGLKRIRELRILMLRQQELRNKIQRQLANSGLAALRRKYRRVYACETLQARGAAARAHVTCSAVARKYLEWRVEQLGGLHDRHKKAQQLLSEAGVLARGMAAKHAAAQSWLRRQLATIKSSEPKRGLARVELASLVRRARDLSLATELAKRYPKRLEQLVKQAREDTANEWKEAMKMQSQGVEGQVDSQTAAREIIARAVFKYYDDDDSGTIDRIEFEAMMRSGALLGLSKRPKRHDLVDAFAQIDTDASGRISVDEFLPWFQHTSVRLAEKHGTGRHSIVLGDVISARDRALKQLCDEFQDQAEEILFPVQEKKATEQQHTRRSIKTPTKPSAAIHSMSEAAGHRVKGENLTVPVQIPSDKLTTESRLKDNLIDHSRNGAPLQLITPGIAAPLSQGREKVIESKSSTFDDTTVETTFEERYAADFLARGRRVFEQSDVKGSGWISQARLEGAIARESTGMRSFLAECGKGDLEALLAPAGVEEAFANIDRDGDGLLSITEWNAAVETALIGQLKRVTVERKEDDAFASQYRSLANEIFSILTDGNDSTLTADKIWRTVRLRPEVADFLARSPNEGLRGLVTSSVEDDVKKVVANKLDANGDEALDAHEWHAAVEAALSADLEKRQTDRDTDRLFASKFRVIAREVFYLVDGDDDGFLTPAEIRAAISRHRQVKALLDSSVELRGIVLDTDDKTKTINLQEWQRIIDRALDAKLGARRALRRGSKEKHIAEATAHLSVGLDVAIDPEMPSASAHSDKEADTDAAVHQEYRIPAKQEAHPPHASIPAQGDQAFQTLALTKHEDNEYNATHSDAASEKSSSEDDDQSVKISFGDDDAASEKDENFMLPPVKEEVPPPPPPALRRSPAGLPVSDQPSRVCAIM